MAVSTSQGCTVSSRCDSSARPMACPLRAGTQSVAFDHTAGTVSATCPMARLTRAGFTANGRMRGGVFFGGQAPQISSFRSR